MSNRYLLTGTDTVTLRKKFLSLKKTYSDSNFVEIDLSSVTPEEVAETLSLSDLFSQRVFVFTNFSQTTVKVWQSVVEFLGDKPAIFEAIGKKIGRIPAQLKKTLTVVSLDEKPIIFDLLSRISKTASPDLPKFFQTVLQSTPEPIVMTMVANRIRDLIIAKTSPGSLVGAPWQKDQLTRQAAGFSIEDLVKIYRRLLSLEVREKNSLNPDAISSHFIVELLSQSN